MKAVTTKIFFYFTQSRSDLTSMGSEMRLQSRFWFTWAVAYVTYIFCALIWVDRSYLWDVIFVRSTYMSFKATFGLTDFVANCTSQVIRAGWNCSVRKRNFGSRVWFDMANVTCLRKQDTITMLAWPSLNRWRKASHISSQTFSALHVQLGSPQTTCIHI